MLSISVPDVPRSTEVKVTGVTLTFFGDPAEQDGVTNTPSAFFTNPTDCKTGPLKATLETNSWVDPGRWVSKEATMYEASPSQGVSGCNLLQFDPSIAITPETTQADTPSGYEAAVKTPQAPNLSSVLATPELKEAIVALPEGVSISPGVADGLTGCQETGPEGINITHNWAPTGEQPLDPDEPEAMKIGPDGLSHVERGHCPLASQIGEVEVITPVLPSPLHGHVYVAQPACGGENQSVCTEASAVNGELFTNYGEVEGSGIIIKLKGRVEANPQTGQLTERFDEIPQLPFSEVKVKLTGGPRAPLANPQGCGEARTTSAFTPWSAPASGGAATPFSSFAITSSPNGPCGPQSFAPSFTAGAIDSQAGAFSPFTATLSRRDGEQDLSGISVTAPSGLLGAIKSAVQCPEPQAQKGECGPQSLIGHCEVAVGAGSHPFWAQGNVYLTGPYKGAPFGLSVVTPAKAGPFNLGNVIVRAAIYISPNTSVLTAVSDPFPQIIDGIPLRVQTVNVTIDRAGFMFNPTNCSQQAVTGTITSAQGESVDVSSPFTVEGCANLPFKPSLAVSTQAKTSKANGASLLVKIGSTPGQANVAKTRLVLPEQLPARLTTLQKACVDKVFYANPAACPAGSVVGTATVHTPVLTSPLTGPIYLVSHGGVAFPDAVIVMQGEGVTLYLDGNTNIKKGITSSTFSSVPDAPFSSFEAKLPQGPHSVFAANIPAKANGNMCGQKLTIPITLTGQNGAVLMQNAKVGVTGCPKAVRHERKKTHKKKKKK